MSNAGRLPVIALVGRPNVGKSTLFNRLTGTRDAIVANEPGLTRDRQYGFARRAGKRFLVVDTGGLTEGAEGLEAIAGEQSRIAVAEADCVLFLVDGRAGRTSDDDLIAEELRRSGKPIFLVVNKCERLEPNQTAAEFLAWGFADWFAVSAAQGQGVAAMTARLMGDSDDANDSGDSGNSSAADDDDDAGRASVTDDRSESGYDEDDVEEDDDHSDDFDDLDDLELDDLESLEIDDPEYRAGLAIDDSRPRRVVIVGTPNAGKSTLVNQLLGEERVMASEIPGTTRDSIDVPFRYGEQDYVLVDTAGIRRRAKVQETIEKFSVIKAMQAIELADVVVVLLDAERGLTTQDERVLGLVAERGRACVIAINKWDLVSRAKAAEMRADFAHALKYLDFIRIRTLSAKKGHGIRDLFNSVTEAWEAAHAKLPTPVLSRLLEKAVTQNPPPAVHGRRIKLRYAHQGGMNPVRIIVHGNQASEVPPNYRRYLVKQFREHFRLYGAPIEIELRTGDNPYKHKRNVLTPRQLRKRKRIRGR